MGGEDVAVKKMTAADVVRKVSAVSTLPVIYSRINEAVNNPRSSLEDIASVIREDIGLTVRLLKLVNSALFGFPSKIDSVSAACVIVGTMQLRSLALATTVMGVFKHQDEQGVDVNLFWEHCIGSAMLSSALARKAGELHVERFFLCGMLHDIGRLIMLRELESETTEIIHAAREQHRLTHEVENEVLGFTHADVGGSLLAAWNLPMSLIEAVKNHHQPGRGLGYPVECSSVHVADVVAHAMMLGDSGNELVPPVEPCAVDRLNIDSKGLRQIVAEVDGQFDEMVEMILR